MTDDDKLIDSMFDEVKSVHVEMVNGKPRISDEATLAAMEIEEAQAAFLVAEKRFRALSEHPNVATDKRLNLRWWDALETLYQCDKRLWLLFVGPDRSVRSNMKYNEYGERLIKGKRLYRADA